MVKINKKKVTKSSSLKKEEPKNDPSLIALTAEIPKPSFKRPVEVPHLNAKFRDQKKEEPKKEIQTEEPINKKNPGYVFAGRVTLIEWLREVTPKEIIPTTKSAYIVGFLYITVLLHAVFIFPYGNFLNPATAATEMPLKAGWPWIFFDLNLVDPEGFPLDIWLLIADNLIFLLIAYMIDISINFAKRIQLISSLRGEEKRYPRIYSDMKPKSTADAITKQVFKVKTPTEPLPKKFVVKTTPMNSKK